MTAPPSISCVSDVYTPGITLGARVTGDWTRALNKYAQEKRCLDSKVSSTQVQVMLDGPYGGCSLDLGHYETVLLFAGGSGVTFTLGMLDDIVGRCVRLGRPNGERTRRIEFAWCVKSFGKYNLPIADLFHYYIKLISRTRYYRVVCPCLDGTRSKNRFFRRLINATLIAYLSLCHLPV